LSDKDGHTLYQWTPPVLTDPVLDARVAYLITDILSDDVARIPSFGRYSALSIGRPAAAKTGTTTDFRDNWVVGYTPHFVVGVWVGNADNTPMTDVTGVSGAGPIWNQFMRHIHKTLSEQAFARPSGIIQREVCVPSGLVPTPQCPRRRLELFISGTEPTAYDNLYQRVTIDTANGAPADDQTPPERRAERLYLLLPQEARDWGARNGILPPPDPLQVAWPDADVGLRLLEPDPYTIFELSPLLPRAAQRIKLTVGAPPQTQSVTYYLDGEALATVTAAPWAHWWPLELGQHELTARAQLSDGTILEARPIPFSVVNWGER
jgi:membrane carboxypeptidase/penicillin-binding protein PbpC